MFHARIMPAGADRLVERIVGAAGAEGFAVSGAKSLDRGWCQRDLVDRLDLKAFELLLAALRQGVELPDVLNLVTEEIDA